jgi:AcrR family transcriptional regulator
MPKPKGANRTLYAATHAHILDAATTLFAAKGFAAVTTPEVAMAAGVAHGSVFHHFPTKRDLFVAVHNRFQLRLIEGIAAAADLARDPWSRFDAIWRAYLAATEDPDMRRILLLDGPRVVGLDELRRQDRDTAFAFLMAEVEALAAADLIRPGSVRAITILLFGALDQAAFEIADFPEDRELRDRLAAEFAALLHRLRVGATSPESRR